MIEKNKLTPPQSTYILLHTPQKSAASKELGAPIYDGYLQAGSASSIAPINTFAPRGNFWEAAPGFTGYIVSSEPYVVLNAETETPYRFSPQRRGRGSSASGKSSKPQNNKAGGASCLYSTGLDYIT